MLVLWLFKTKRNQNKEDFKNKSLSLTQFEYTNKLTSKELEKENNEMVKKKKSESIKIIVPELTAIITAVKIIITLLLYQKILNINNYGNKTFLLCKLLKYCKGLSLSQFNEQIYFEFNYNCMVTLNELAFRTTS